MADNRPRRNSDYFGSVIEQRLSRRSVLGGAAALAGAAMGAGLVGCSLAPGSRGFTPISGATTDRVELPEGFFHDVVIRWGESLFSDTPDLDTRRIPDGVLLDPGAARMAARQFGSNCDAFHLFALNDSADHGIACINNEYVDPRLMFPRLSDHITEDRRIDTAWLQRHPEAVAVMKASIGVTVVELIREGGHWRFLRDSPYNRRLTAETPMELRGPVRGSELIRSVGDPAGRWALGTVGNCAGGRTPWGTYLSAEENIQDYFGDWALARRHPDLDARLRVIHDRFPPHQRTSWQGWERVDPRFLMTRNPHEPLRFGWVVEVDPYEPERPAIKRTALGRFSHECATTTTARGGEIVVYSGDDRRFEYVYKFVSKGKFNAREREANRHLLDEGVLHVARFNADGTGMWLPLVHDPQGILSGSTGFPDQATVLLNTRGASDLLGATPMDRPEDIAVSPLTGKVYVACTHNTSRGEAQAGPRGVDAVNPRVGNRWGHIVEIHEDGDDHAARTFRWELLLLAGDPLSADGRFLTQVTGKPLAADDTYFAGFEDAGGLAPFGAPDNLDVDRFGNLWIVTDGDQPRGSNNGCFVAGTEGAGRGQVRQFMSAPLGAEVCGCKFNADGTTLFLNIQHPGENGTVEDPESHWPDGPDRMPRSSLIAVSREDGGVIEA
ncbi:MAG: PhoX family phosphatase [Gammaproteobacteria bacterium]|nr:PhoX family phosphatase [Gammaproteobacteria bacterium]